MAEIPADVLAEAMEVKPTGPSKAPGAKCWECPLRNKPMAPTQDPNRSEIILVSRSPGYHEAMAGKPFSGPGGKILDHLLKMNGVTRDEIAVTNVVLCAPDAGQVPKEAIKACSPRLDRELEHRTTVISAGAEAVKRIIGPRSIDSYRGYIIPKLSISGKHQRHIATNNPALVLHDDSKFPNLIRDFRRAFNPMPEPKLPEVTLVREADSCASLLASISRSNDAGTTIAVDIETRGGLHHQIELVSIQFSIAGTKALVLGEPGITERRSIEELRNLLGRSDLRFVYHNGKFDVKALRHSYGVNVKLNDDTLLLSYALDERSGGDDMVGVHGLEYLLMEEFGWPKYETEDIKKFKKDGIVRNWDEFALYAGYDVAGTKQLFNLYEPRVYNDPDLVRAYREMLIDGAELTMKMELRGMIYDVNEAADTLEFEVWPEMENIKSNLRRIGEKPLLNPNSHTQMAVLFYDEWDLQHAMRSRPDKNRSVDDSARTEIIEGRYKIGNHSDDIRPTVEAFVKEYDRWQQLTKQESTYLRGLILVAARDPESRLYTEIVLHGTNSGRVSSRKPNLQNITRTGRHENLPNIRKLFKPSPGRVFVQADYSQAELRCMAAFSGDTELTKVYTEGLDLHNIAASRFYGENYTNENRQSAKNMNFGVGYLQSAATFQEKHGIPEAEAAQFIKWWRSYFKGVFSWHDSIRDDIRSKGILTSPFGRKRRFYLLTRENLQASIREGINFYPQSTASDLTLSSAILIDREINPDKAALVLTIHDAILGDVVDSYVDEFKAICIGIMESRAKEAIGWTLPFKADCGVGPSWAEAK